MRFAYLCFICPTFPSMPTQSTPLPKKNLLDTAGTLNSTRHFMAPTPTGLQEPPILSLSLSNECSYLRTTFLGP
ncbi:hypothetical protein BJX99DRAFT_231143 [Aspergillus californicus]